MVDDNIYDRKTISRRAKSAAKKRYTEQVKEFRVYAVGIGYLTDAIPEKLAYALAGKFRNEHIYNGIKIVVEKVKS